MVIAAETILSSLAHLFAYEGRARDVAIMAHAEAELVQSDYDNWDGGTYGYTLIVRLPPSLYVQISGIKEECEEAISDKAAPLFGEKEYLRKVFIQPKPAVDSEWRDKARAWLAGLGVTNQGRVRSDNIAARECDGLLFRSEPEILLYRALKPLGVSFAPLAVFIRGGVTYQRMEPDFIILKDGMVMVVEVDGDTVHHETPAEAHARTAMLVHEGAHVERIKASQCDTPERAAQSASYLVGLFDKLRKSGR